MFVSPWRGRGKYAGRTTTVKPANAHPTAFWADNDASQEPVQVAPAVPGPAPATASKHKITPFANMTTHVRAKPVIDAARDITGPNPSITLPMRRIFPVPHAPPTPRARWGTILHSNATQDITAAAPHVRHARQMEHPTLILGPLPIAIYPHRKHCRITPGNINMM